MASFSVFAENMRKYGDAVERNAPLILRRTALAVDQTVVLATPVGNPDLWKSAAPKGYIGGHARANWQVNIGAPASGEVDGKGPGAGADAIAKGAGVIQGAKAGDAIHITNNLAYITPLNEGHSTQAPPGFVEQAIAAGQEAVHSSKILGS